MRGRGGREPKHDLSPMVTLVCILLFAGTLVVLELLFRRSRRLAGKVTDYPSVRRDPAYVVPHPFLPFAYKSGASTPALSKLPYPLHDNIYAPQLRVNSLGFPAAEPLPDKKGLRVVCIGSSVTMNTVQEGPEGLPFSYPGYLKEYVESSLGSGSPVEVVPMAMGSWTSAEIVVNFVLRVIDLRPDIVCLYHANNDLQAFLTPGFRPDYSHFRRNLGETLPLTEMYTRLWRFFPDVPVSRLFGHLKSRMIMFLVRLLTGQAFPFGFPYRSLRENLGSLIRVGQLDPNLPFSHLEAERRNFEAIIHLCKGSGSLLVLSTYAYYNYDPSNPNIGKYGEGVRLENEMIRRLASDHRLPLADVADAIPSERDYFLDVCHLTSKGSRIQAQVFADKILSQLEKDRKPPTLSIPHNERTSALHPAVPGL